MRDFYEQVRIDEMKMRFYAQCPICGKRENGDRLPLLCRDKEILIRLQNGQADKIRQKTYDKSRVAAIRHLARSFNLCRSCGKWVCDDCHDIDSDYGFCRECEAHSKNHPPNHPSHSL